MRIYGESVGQPLPSVSEELQTCFPTYGPIHAALWWMSESTDAPPIFQLGSVLAAVAQEAARRGFRIGVKEQIVPSVWAALVGPPGVSKSTVLRRTQALVREFRQRIQGDKYKDPFFVMEGSIQGIIEGLAGECYDSERDLTSAILWLEELTRIIEHREQTVDLLNQLADNVSVKRHLRSHQAAKAKGEIVNDHLKNPALSGIFCATETSLRDAMTERHVSGGFFSRLWWFCGKLKPEDMRYESGLNPAEMEQTLDIWTSWCTHLDGLEVAAGLTDSSTSATKILKLTDEVNEIIRVRIFEPNREAIATDERLGSAIRRSLEKTKILTALYAFSRGEFVASAIDAIQACKMIEVLTASASHLSEHLGVNQGYRMRMSALDAIKQAGKRGMKRSDMYKVLRENKRELDLVIDGLLDSAEIFLVAESSSNKRGPKTVRYYAREYLNDVQVEEELN